MARKEARIATLTNVFERLGQTALEVRTDPERNKVPVGASGLVVRRPNSVLSLSREMRATLKRLEQLPLLLNFDMDSSRYLTLLLIGQPLLRRTLSLQMHEALRQRIGVHYHLEGLTREELDAYLTHQLKAAGVSQPLFDDTARQGLYQATKGIPRKVNKLALTALRLAASRKLQLVNEALLLDATSEALLYRCA